MLITLSGRARSGKDTTGDILVEKFNFTKIALADPLRSLCSKVFDIPLNTFLDDNLKEKAFEYPVSLTASDLGYIMAIVEHEWGFEVTEEAARQMKEFEGFAFENPRKILQIVGTEIIRGSIDDAIFLKLADKRINSCPTDVVVTDVRFKVEQEWAKNKGAIMCLIKRPNNKLKVDSHRSENELDDETMFRTVFTNDADLSRFQIEVTEYFNEIMRKRSQ